MPSTPAAPEAWRDPAIIDRHASRHYMDLEFHNYPHTYDVEQCGLTIAAIARAHGVAIDLEVFKPASAYHDAGKQLRPGIDHRLPTSEAYAARIADAELRMLGMPEPKVELTCDVIGSTDPAVPCATDTARCFLQGDLRAGGLLARDPVILLRGTSRLYREDERLKGNVLIPPYDADNFISGFVEFGGVCHEKLSTFLEEDLSVGPHQRTKDGRSLFNMQALRTIGILLPERLGEFVTEHFDEIVNPQPAGV